MENFRSELSNLLRDCGLKDLLDFIGPEYDFQADPYGVLSTAAHYGNENILLHALNHGGDPNGDENSLLPLGSVCARGRMKLAKLLLDRGADASRVDRFGRTAMISSAGAGKIPAIKLLMQAGASLDGALNAAVDRLLIPTVRFLIEEGAALDQLDCNDLTPLLNACFAGKKKGSEIALLLLRAGADATYVRASDGMSAIKFGYWGYGECSQEVFAELRARGAPEPGPDFEIVRLV